MSGRTDFNYFSGNPLNRISFLRESPAFLTSCLVSPKAKFILYDNLSPLLAPGNKLTTVDWSFIAPFVSAPNRDTGKEELLFGSGDKDQKKIAAVDSKYLEDKGIAPKTPLEELSDAVKEDYYLTRPALVLLGLDESTAPDSEVSIPIKKPDENSTLESHSTHGIPYWALDVGQLGGLKEQAQKFIEGSEYLDLRMVMGLVDKPEAGILAQGRALLDWNIRNRYCQGCSRPMRSVWGGWKRVCVDSAHYKPDLQVCPSKGPGVQNYNYPRTDPVVIMAVLSSDQNSILLGRQKPWPKQMYSAIAGFVEFGESLEEAVAREVFEEAGVEVDQVFYHSSQPWPFPSSLMLGLMAIAKPNQNIRLDLDNELEDAKFFTREQVLASIEDMETSGSRESIYQADSRGGAAGFKIPPTTAIAHALIKAWATGKYIGPKDWGKL